MLAALEREAGQPWSVGIARKPIRLHPFELASNLPPPLPINSRTIQSASYTPARGTSAASINSMPR
jgi:hypothetical protein